MIKFTDEQSMLLETAADFCRNHGPIEKVRASLDADDIDRGLWQEMSDLGWLGINVPEEYGCLGLDISSIVPVVESMGRYLLGSPYVSSVLVAECLASCGSDSQRSEWLPKIVAGTIGTFALTEEDGSWVLDDIEAVGTVSDQTLHLTGTKMFVTDADVADLIIASVKIDGAVRLVLIERNQIPPGNLSREVVIDQTRRSFRLNLDGIEISASQVLAGSDLKAIELNSMLMLCAEMSGGLTGVLQVIVEYLNTRKAFNRLIGSYQSLKHPSADIVLSLEAAKSHLYYAATLVSDGDDNAETAIRMAKAQASEAFAFAGDRAVQFHGGFGFTFECDAQLFLRRALWCQYQHGDENYHCRLLEPLLLDQAV